MNLDALIAGACGISFGAQAARWVYRQRVKSLKEHVAALKEQVEAGKTVIRTTDTLAEKWEELADLAQTEARDERQKREVAERRLTLVRDNMHREREP